MPVRGLKQKDHKFQASQGYVAKPDFKKGRKKRKGIIYYYHCHNW
jgi:hypothetical protein